MNDFFRNAGDFITGLSEGSHPFFYATPILILWLVFFWFIKRLLVRRLRKWTSKTKHRLDDIVVDAISFPANFLILASGLAVCASLLPLSEKVDRLTAVAFQSSIIFAAIFFLDKFLAGLLAEYGTLPLFNQVSKGVVKGLVRASVIGIGILIFLQQIGISITPILASLGIGSLAVALALQDTLSNFFAGMYVAIDKPVEVGQFVRLESGEEGYVIDVGWRSTRIRTLPNSVIIVPNSKLMGSVITNYYLPDKEMAVLVQVGVHYQSDLKRVERVTCEVGKEIMEKVQGGVPGFEPFIRYHTFGDSSVNFTVILRGKEFVDQHLLKHEFIKNLHDRYQKENIIIPYPIRTLEFSRGVLETMVLPNMEKK